jgi:hypothetical protein
MAVPGLRLKLFPAAPVPVAEYCVNLTDMSMTAGYCVRVERRPSRDPQDSVRYAH